MSNIIFMGYDCNLFDVIIAHSVAIFISIKRKILEIQSKVVIITFKVC